MKFREIAVSMIGAGKIIRRPGEDEEVRDLTKSVSQYGLLQPIVVRRDDGKFVCIAGHRRLAALIHAGQKIAPCIIVDVPEREVPILRLTENIQRRQLSAVEIVEAIEEMRKELPGLTQREAADLLNKSYDWVHEKYRYVASRERMIEAGADAKDIDALPEAHVIRMSMADPKKARGIAKEAVAKKWSSRQVYDASRESNDDAAAKYPSEVMAEWNGRFGIYVYDGTTLVLKLRLGGDLMALKADLQKIGGQLAAVRPVRPAKGKWQKKAKHGTR